MVTALPTTVMAARGSLAAAGSIGAGGGARPALGAYFAAHDRERRRMGIPTQEGYAQWAGVDPADWSRWRRGRTAIPGHQGRRMVALFDHEPRWRQLWLRLVQEQEHLALLAEELAGSDRMEAGPPPTG